METRKDEAIHKALKVLNCLNNNRVYETAWVKGAINACEEALEQPAQEQLSGKTGELNPVAYWNGSTSFEYNNYGGDGFIVAEFEVENWKPLYTYPHQWQGLTDDEINEVCLELFETPAVQGDLEFCYAIEAKLKEKNND